MTNELMSNELKTEETVDMIHTTSEKEIRVNASKVDSMKALGFKVGTYEWTA
jgi:hypothetical protein